MSKQELQERADALQAELNKLRETIERADAVQPRTLTEAAKSDAHMDWAISEHGSNIMGSHRDAKLRNLRERVGNSFDSNPQADRHAQYRAVTNKLWLLADKAGIPNHGGLGYSLTCHQGEWRTYSGYVSYAGEITFPTQKSAQAALDLLSDEEKDILLWRHM